MLKKTVLNNQKNRGKKKMHFLLIIFLVIICIVVVFIVGGILTQRFVRNLAFTLHSTIFYHIFAVKSSIFLGKSENKYAPPTPL